MTQLKKQNKEVEKRREHFFVKALKELKAPSFEWKRPKNHTYLALMEWILVKSQLKKGGEVIIFIKFRLKYGRSTCLANISEFGNRIEDFG